MRFLEWTQFEKINSKHVKNFKENQNRDTIYRCIRWCENNPSPGIYSYRFDNDQFQLGFEYQADAIMFDIFYRNLIK